MSERRRRRRKWKTLLFYLHIEYLELVDEKVRVLLLQVEEESCELSEQDSEECARYAEQYRDKEREKLLHVFGILESNLV